MIPATGFGSGYFPVASGTAGTLFAGVPLYLLLYYLAPVWWVYGVVTMLLISVGPFLCGQADCAWNTKDCGKIVYDEMIGFLVTMAFIPLSIWTLAAGFFLFRAFDVLKVYPANLIERKLPGGAGVFFDDIAAGVYSNFCLWGFVLLTGDMLPRIVF